VTSSLVNGYHNSSAPKSVIGQSSSAAPLIGGSALTLSQAIARCNSLTDVLFGDTEFLSSTCSYSCQSDDTNEVLVVVVVVLVVVVVVVVAVVVVCDHNMCLSCSDKQDVCAYLQPFPCWISQEQ